jgi:hypothetical protein
MAGRGGLYAITPEEAARLEATPLEERWEFANDLAQESPGDCYLDKSWEPLHRCLTDGTVEPGKGTYPLNRCLLGGKELCGDNGDYVYLVTPAEARDVAAALQGLSLEWLRERYALLAHTDYAQWMNSDDQQGAVDYFREMRDFYQEVVRAGDAVIFTFGV